MCRWITLISAKRMTLSDAVLTPTNSLVQLSRDASFHPGYDNINNAIMNGDGFGIGWYHSNYAVLPDPHLMASNDGSRSNPVSNLNTPDHSRYGLTNGVNGVHHTNGIPSAPRSGPPEDYRAAALFKDVFPAWNNENLHEICTATASDCFMAHVRAASPKTGISLQNCHPFKAGRLLFCHNGRIANFSRFRRNFLAKLDDEAFNHIRGTTDSEAVFGLVLTILAKDGHGSPISQTNPFGAKRLVAALKKAIRQIEVFLLESGIYGDEEYSTCNYSLTDGDTMVVTRYCDRPDVAPPPSLYFAFGDADTLYQELTNESLGAPLFESKINNNRNLSSRTSSMMDMSDSSTADDAVSVDSSDSGFDEAQVKLEQAESKPGKILQEIDPTNASFIVASNPLTKTHLWHKLPQNSIMLCSRGAHPELRLLRRKNNTMSLGEPFELRKIMEEEVTASIRRMGF